MLQMHKAKTMASMTTSLCSFGTQPATNCAFGRHEVVTQASTAAAQADLAELWQMPIR